jgi:uncharacterized protein Yka (UPF0111/DUF47 family)
MFGRVRSVTRELAGQGGEELVEHLDGQLAATEEAAELAACVARAELGGTEAVTRAKALEHRGDEHRRELNVLLAASLAPPMDREDLVRLSRSVDDVLDNLDDLVIELDLYGITREPLLDAPLEGVGQGVRLLRAAVDSIVDAPEECRALAVRAKRNEIRPRYQAAMAELLGGDGPVERSVLRRREVLRRVDVIGLRLGEAADALTDGAIKRSR